MYMYVSWPCSKGMMQSERESRRMSARLLTCTHTASGHTAGVLCVYATQNYLFSSSQGTHWRLCTYPQTVFHVIILLQIVL